MRKNDIIKSGDDMYAGAAALFALLGKIHTDDDGSIRRAAMIAVTTVDDGQKLQAALELLKTGMQTWPTREEANT
ncbi:MAG: hypothetical protein ACO329_11590 [Steroidobacteraceae bacterium]